MKRTVQNKKRSYSDGERRRLTQGSLERMHLPSRFWNVMFDRITNEGECRKMIETYVRKIGKAMLKGYGMVLWGANGVGKTAAAAYILKEARRRGKTGLFITVSQYIRDSMEKSRFDESFTMDQRARSVNMLVLDDLGKEFRNSTVPKHTIEGMLEDLLRERSSNLRSTIITSNLSPKQLTEAYGCSFYEVIRETSPLVQMLGLSHRDTGKDDLVQFF